MERTMTKLRAALIVAASGFLSFFLSLSFLSLFFLLPLEE